MLKSSKLLVVIPAYNEEESIAETIVDVQRNIPDVEILVVDDGSIDKTKEKAKQLSVKVITLPFNCGVGAALRTGLIYGSDNNYERILVIDGDGQHPAVHAGRILERGTEKNLVIGVRSYTDYNFSTLRRLAHRFLVLLLRLRTRLNIQDPTSGYRLFSNYAATKLISGLGSEYLEDTLGILQKLDSYGIDLEQIGVQMNQRQRGVQSNRGYKLVKRYSVAVLMILAGRSSK
jgi:glycosyltransferase involved in cell wall biosynthesis